MKKIGKVKKMNNETDLFFVGIAIVSICIGYATAPLFGWLFFGSMLILISIRISMKRRREEEHEKSHNTDDG